MNDAGYRSQGHLTCSRTGLLGRGVVAGLVALLVNLSAYGKEPTMADKDYTYHPYTPGMTLPDGVFPPLQGYTHGDLIAAAQVRVEAYLKAHAIDATLIRESLVTLATHLNETFEREGVEYQVSSWYQKPYDDPAARTRSVKAMGEEYGSAAVEAAAESLEGSPLLRQGRAFYKGYIGAAGEAVRDRIVALNTPEA